MLEISRIVYSPLTGKVYFEEGQLVPDCFVPILENYAEFAEQFNNRPLMIDVERGMKLAQENSGDEADYAEMLRIQSLIEPMLKQVDSYWQGLADDLARNQIIY